ncbi:hypothetical protein SAMN06265338_101525 [Rhodoblastus acidophilus]|uniref:KAP NTPase domain-containing protein n=2 Tax=Rhodoblastus acidophilus TaxID=1074 RepID=A0A212QBT0_RHOAC|nr:hypothetical protein [Rhodoblastus acidophilus]PPQ40051.1 hypothetical protein CKO16_04455 [Rhodoblastus acidophilus]SNB56851.1 hypothetical protein SAMN06265338_101525 [Rhodoblastus acidophilus]
MTDFERDFLSDPPISRFPAPKPAPAAPAAPAPAPAVAVSTAFVSDSPLPPEAYAPPQPALLARFADLAQVAPTPFALALAAPAGGGKSSALGWIAARLGSGAVARFEAADLAVEPERALAAGLYRALAPTQGELVGAAAREADSAADAGAAARESQDRLDLMRKKLLTERQALSDLQARRAALSETLLYESPGSRVDHFARRMRGGFAERMRGFGLTGDPLLTFKDLTRDLAAHSGASRWFAGWRAVYAYRGQSRLLVYAALLYFLSQGLDWASRHRAEWLDWLSHAHEAGAQTADILRSRLGALDSGATLALLLALVCVGLNLWRAYSFFAPLLRAARLLDEEVAARAREADEAVVEQGSVVERLTARVAVEAQAARDAERRAEGAGALKNPAGFLAADAQRQRRDQALGFLDALSAALKAKNARLTVMVDGVETDAALESIAALLARPGFVALFAVDPSLCGGRAQLRLLQVPMRLDFAGETPALATLDAPLSAAESRLLDALTPVAGDTPRAKKRLRNFYLFLRPAPGGEADLGPALALCLAQKIGGHHEALHAASQGLGPHRAETFAMAQQIAGPISSAALKRAAALAGALAG